MRNAVGLDISQEKFDAAVIVGNIKQNAEFTNDPKGFESLKDWLDKFNCPDLHICMEATGNYYEDVADYIGRFYKVSVINPYKIHEYGKSRFQRTKTDKQDAKLIAEYCHTALEKDLPVRDTVSACHYRLKRVLALYEQLKAQKTAEKNRLKTAKDDFVKQIHAGNIKYLSEQVRTVRNELTAIIKQRRKFKTISDGLKTIPAVGSLTAAILTNYLLSGKFKNANQFTAFAGLNPQAKESGKSVKGKAKLTRYGNRRLRSALFMPAMVALRRGYFSALVNRLKSKGKPPMVILVAVMRKLAVIAFHLCRKGEKFDSQRYKPA
ncbi:IS110 family transposase [Neisseria sp.]|uniref:IS110 family transposase n=1 Tax=Neisseria sp. TaxID=192066 RepID=UPI0026DD980D|nr:IS110 family transposase [Neisseria sp.]MDO4226827.1 IS110 family transposase [Neisseria sp.]